MSHIVSNCITKDLKCLTCGASEDHLFDVPVDVFVQQINNFSKKHAPCAPPEEEEEDDDYEND